MSNWKPHTDYSHPNWTGTTPNTRRYVGDIPLNSRDRDPNKIQKLAWVGMAAFLFGCWLLIQLAVAAGL